MASATVTSRPYKFRSVRTNIEGGNVTSILWRRDDQASVAEIEIPRLRFHQFRQYNAGQPVWITISDDGVEKVVFKGWVTGRTFEFSPESENVTLICADDRWILSGGFLKGQLCLNKDGKYHTLTGYKCVFNEFLQGSLALGNASKVKATGEFFNGVKPFAVNPFDAVQCEYFTINDIVWYIYQVGRNWLNDTLIAGAPLPNCLSLTAAGLGGDKPTSFGKRILNHMNIDGMSITGAFDYIFRNGSACWWTRPATKESSDLVVKPNNDWDANGIIIDPDEQFPPIAKKILYCPTAPAGTLPQDRDITLAGLVGNEDKCQLEAGRIDEDFSESYNNVYVFGARKIFQYEFTLKPGWDFAAWNELKTIADTSKRRQYLREGDCPPEYWPKFREVGRKWILNEDGSVKNPDGSAGTPYDFGTIDLFYKITGRDWATRPRPFLSDNPDGLQIPPIKFIVSGVEYTCKGNIRLLDDRAGIYVEGDEIIELMLLEPTWTWRNEVIMKLSVREDMANYAVQRGGNFDSGFLAGNNTGNGYVAIKRHKGVLVENEYQTDNYDPQNRELIINQAMDEFAKMKLRNMQNPRFSSSFSIPWITMSYEPGDYLTKIEGRNLNFVGQVKEVRFEFGEQQRTEIILEDLRLAES